MMAESLSFTEAESVPFVSSLPSKPVATPTPAFVLVPLPTIPTLPSSPRVTVTVASSSPAPAGSTAVVLISALNKQPMSALSPRLPAQRDGEVEVTPALATPTTYGGDIVPPFIDATEPLPTTLSWYEFKSVPPAQFNLVSFPIIPFIVLLTLFVVAISLTSAYVLPDNRFADASRQVGQAFLIYGCVCYGVAAIKRSCWWLLIMLAFPVLFVIQIIHSLYCAANDCVIIVPGGGPALWIEDYVTCVVLAPLFVYIECKRHGLPTKWVWFVLFTGSGALPAFLTRLEMKDSIEFKANSRSARPPMFSAVDQDSHQSSSYLMNGRATDGTSADGRGSGGRQNGANDVDADAIDAWYHQRLHWLWILLLIAGAAVWLHYDYETSLRWPFDTPTTTGFVVEVLLIGIVWASWFIPMTRVESSVGTWVLRLILMYLITFHNASTICLWLCVREFTPQQSFFVRPVSHIKGRTLNCLHVINHTWFKFVDQFL